MDKLVSHPQFPVVMGLAFAMGLYVAFGPNPLGPTRKRRKADPRGLINTGNSCFINAILQALASCPSFLAWLETKSKCEDISTLQGALHRTLEVLNNINALSEPDSYEPIAFLRSLRNQGWLINRDEQDAHEMLHVILSTLEEELLRTERLTTSTSLFDALSDMTSEVEAPLLERECKSEASTPMQEQAPTDKSFRRGHRRRNSGVIIRSGEELSVESVQHQTKTLTNQSTPFTGTLTNKLSYASGESKSTLTSTTFNNITLNLPSGKSAWPANSVALETLLQMFVSRESVENVDDKSSGDIVKQLTFGRLPDCLCFHIQRTAFESGVPSKRSDRVAFPLTLDMDNYVYTRQVSKSRAIAGLGSSRESTPDLHPSPTHNNHYYLRAVVMHLGVIQSGHYVTYRKGPAGSKFAQRWFYTSDLVVREVDVQEVLGCEAYMLFYEKETAA